MAIAGGKPQYDFSVTVPICHRAFTKQRYPNRIISPFMLVYSGSEVLKYRFYVLLQLDTIAGCNNNPQPDSLASTF